MEKINLENNIIDYPMPVVLVGTKVNGKSDFLAVSWITMVSDKPCKVAISLNKNHNTTKGVKENNAFSICIPSKGQVKNVDYCGVVSGENSDKADLFHLFYGKLDGTPMIEECAINAECKLENVVECGDHELFIVEIMKVYADKGVVSDNKVLLDKLEPIILDGSCNKYREIGNVIDDAFKTQKLQNE